MTATTSHPVKRFRRIVLIDVALGILFIVGTFFLLRQSARDALVIPDEKAAAAALLDEKLSGPRYFHPNSAERGTGTVSHFSGGELRISLEDVHSQVDRVVQERHFNAEQRMELQKLIERLAEPSASRIVGEPTV